MKILKNTFRVLAILFSVAALALYFFDFGKVILASGDVTRTGAEFAFGVSYEGNDIGKSTDILFCLILTALTALFSALNFKFNKTKWAALITAGVGAVYMLVIACSEPRKFLDTQGFVDVQGAAYVGNIALFIAIALFLAFVSAICYILYADKLATAGSDKLPIPKKVVKFLKDYKGEILKIVWPGPRAVVKNTIIVIIMCLIIGAFIWLLDWGLGSLLKLLF